LAENLFADNLEDRFLERLALASSNIPKFGNGAGADRRFVTPAMVKLVDVMAHYAVSSLFSEYPEQSMMYAYEVERLHDQVLESGHARLVLGQAKLTSEITREQFSATYGVLHFGDHNVNAGVR